MGVGHPQAHLLSLIVDLVSPMVGSCDPCGSFWPGLDPELLFIPLRDICVNLWGHLMPLGSFLLICGAPSCLHSVPYGTLGVPYDRVM